MEDQAVPQHQLPRFIHDSIRVLNDRISRNTPLFVADDPTTVIARRLGIVLIAVIPTGRGFGEHYATSRLRLNQFHSGLDLQWNCICSESIADGRVALA